MITFTTSTVFNTDAKALVNTVNTVGAMGKGLALAFAKRYPNMLADYKRKCYRKQLRVGKVDFYRDGDTTIVNFPTKAHWRNPSKMEWIESGLADFCARYQDYGITSVAFPKLGAGLGGLPWYQVKALMVKYLADLPIEVYICEDTDPR